MSTILVPIDFSGISTSVVREAVQLARLSGGKLVLLHVIQPPAIPNDFGVVLDNFSVYTAAAEKNAERHLSLLREQLAKAGVDAEGVWVSGYPALCILEQAKKRSADYIVLGSHGHTAFYDLLVGSTATGVLRRASCPVIIVPRAKKAARKAKA